MNVLKAYPKKIREAYLKNISSSGIKNSESYFYRFFINSLMFSILIAFLLFLFRNFTLLLSLGMFIGMFILLHLFFYFNLSIKATERIRKMEESFPDVIGLMSSNLRAGMTVDRAFILSARPEFFPLDEEIMKAGKEITTGSDVSLAMLNMAKRIGSEKITKIIMLIITGIKAGGNISTLLEQTSSNMREKEFLEKRAASNVLMYVIFIFFAVGVGAPILFALSSILVEIIITIVKNLPTNTSSLNMPFTFRDIGLSPTFIQIFALLFIVATDLISSLVIGLVNKGEEKTGLRYFPPLLALSLAIFYGIRLTIGKNLIETFSGLSG
jgi:pilus assembly protein TadC